MAELSKAMNNLTTTSPKHFCFMEQVPIVKKIFEPIEYFFKRYEDVPLSKYANSQHISDLNYLKNSKDSNFSSYYSSKIVPKILKNDLLKNLEKEQTLEIFVIFFIDALPDIIEISPENVLQLICDLSIVKNSETYLNTLKLAILSCRASSKCSLVSLSLILQESLNYIEKSKAHVVASFYFRVIIAWSYIINEPTGVISNTEKIYDFDNAEQHRRMLNLTFVKLFNQSVGLIIENHPHVFSLRTISYVSQEFVNELDITAPSPRAFIDNPDKCTLSTAITISLIIGQIYNALNLTLDNSTSKQIKMTINEIFSLAPIQARDSLLYLVNKFPDIKPQDSIFKKLISFRNSYIIPDGKETLFQNEDFVTNALNHFLFKFEHRIRYPDSILELSQILNYSLNQDLYLNIPPINLIALLSKCLKRFPLFLTNHDVHSFLYMSSVICSLSQMLFSLFGKSENIKTPLMYYLDILLISPYNIVSKPLSFPAEEIQKHISIIDNLILNDSNSWLNFTLYSLPMLDLNKLPMFANLHTLSLIIKNNSDSYDMFNSIKKNINGIIRSSVSIMGSLSFKSLNDISTLWIEIISFLSEFNMIEAIRFAYQTMRTLLNLLCNLEKSEEESSCFILQLFRQLILSPIYHFLLCSYDSILAYMIDRLDFRVAPGTSYQLLLFFNQLLEKNGTNYEVNAMFGMPSYPILVKLLTSCVKIITDSIYKEANYASMNIISLLQENKYSHDICSSFAKKLPDSFQKINDHKLLSSPTVLELQSEINKIVPNRVKKVEIGFKIWKNCFPQGTPIKELLEYAQRNIY